MTDAETSRVALIRFVAPDGTPCVGSGLLVNGQSVLTANHLAGGSDHQVDFHGHTFDVMRILRSGSPAVDLAILTLDRRIAGIAPLGCARVNRQVISEIPRCMAVGFPRWKRDGLARGSAQVNGAIPTGEGLVQTADAGLREGFLTLVGNRQPTAPPIRLGPLTEAGTTSPWGGMSGAVVTAGGVIIGVVRSVNLAGDGQSLTVTPVTGLEHLPDRVLELQFWDALGVADPAGLPLLPTGQEPESDRPPARSGRNTLAAGTAGVLAGTLLSDFMARNPRPSHDKADDAGRGTRHPANDSETSSTHDKGADPTHHGPHDGTHYEDTHPVDGWYDDPGSPHYG